jgi:Rieske Fe-S protein
MQISRREFLILTGTFAAGGCASERAAGGERVVNAGPASNYAADGLYGAFRERGFFIVRRGERLFALSAVCTHKNCKLKPERDRSFYCPCHGSTFDPTGHVTKGPAKRDLPVFDTSISKNGELLVTIAPKPY